MSRLYSFFIASAAIVGFFLIFFFWRDALYDVKILSSSSSIERSPRQSLSFRLHARNNRTEPMHVKGVYLTAYSAGSPKKMDAILSLLKRTELNAVVIDIKDYSGTILYDSHVPLVQELGTKKNILGDVVSLIQKLHDEHIYVIARQTVFQDPLLAKKKPEWAIRDTSGGIWYDYKGLSWVDPTERDVWAYNIALAKEAISLGFDEINFDYIRFPSDGNLKIAVFHENGRPKYESMREFYDTISGAFRYERAWISFDMFGFVMERTDDLNIGQRLVDALDAADFISPMMYPSHYPQGHIGLKNPAAYPEAVLRHGLEKGAPQFVGHRAKLRPWLQAFNLGATYDETKIRAQIDTVEQYTDAGWLLWNAANRYTEAGLKIQ